MSTIWSLFGYKSTRLGEMGGIKNRNGGDQFVQPTDIYLLVLKHNQVACPIRLCHKIRYFACNDFVFVFTFLKCERIHLFMLRKW